MRKILQLHCVFLALVLMVSTGVSKAQLGNGWNYISNGNFDFRIHLQYNDDLNTYDWTTSKSWNNCSYSFTGSTSNYSSGTHKFKLGSSSNCERSELKFDYGYSSSGRYQFEGELRFTSANPPKHVMQIWQNMGPDLDEKIMLLRAKTDGTLYVPGSSNRDFVTNNPYKVADNTWVKINVVHIRSTRMVYIYFNGSLRISFKHASSSGDYYFKMGAYGKIDGELSEEAYSEWRNVKMFKDGYQKSQGVESAQGSISAEISPNPVKDVAKISYSVEKQSKVQISVSDVTGKKIAVLVNQVKDAGSYTEMWNASALPKGVYFLNMLTNEVSKTEKIIVE